MPVVPPPPRPRTEPAADAQRVSVLLVGAGPRSLGVLDRLAAAAADLPDGSALVVHVADPHPPGSGRIWREAQHPLLRMNSRAADVTVLPDATSTLQGPPRWGPALWEWLRDNRSELLREAEQGGDDALRAELEQAGPGSYTSRSLTGRYLRWAWERVLATLPQRVRVEVHRARVVDVLDGADGSQLARLEGAPGFLRVDAVVLAQGHPDVRPGARERRLRAFADAHRLTYVAPGYTGDLDLDVLPAGQDVLVAGMGLAFVDLAVLVGEGRGGRFVRGDDGVLAYVPSGREPVLHVGSRRGVPYRSKLGYDLSGPAPVLPRHLTVAALRERAAGGRLDLRADVWPLVSKELAGAHYAELYASHPARTALPREEFEERFAAAAWGSAELDDLVARAVPDPADRLDLPALDRPLAGWWGASAEEVQRRVQEHVEADLRRRGDPAHSPDAAVVRALLSAYGVVAELARAGLLDPRSAAVDVDGWFHGFFSYVASGPPPERLEQVLALSRAGVVRFLGADVDFGPEPETGTFSARSASGPDVVRARVLVEAQLPRPAAARSADPLLGRLHARGALAEHEIADGEVRIGVGRIAVDAEQRLLDARGAAHPRRFAVGPWVAAGGWAPAFARPGLDAGFFRLNDRVARAVLRAATAPRGASAPALHDSPAGSA